MNKENPEISSIIDRQIKQLKKSLAKIREMILETDEGGKDIEPLKKIEQKILDTLEAFKLESKDP